MANKPTMTVSNASFSSSMITHFRKIRQKRITQAGGANRSWFEQNTQSPNSHFVENGRLNLTIVLIGTDLGHWNPQITASIIPTTIADEQ